MQADLEDARHRLERGLGGHLCTRCQRREYSVFMEPICRSIFGIYNWYFAYCQLCAVGERDTTSVCDDLEEQIVALDTNLHKYAPSLERRRAPPPPHASRRQHGVMKEQEALIGVFQSSYLVALHKSRGVLTSTVSACVTRGMARMHPGKLRVE